MSNRRSQEAKAWRGWYGLAAWRRIRAWRLLVEPLCRFCAALGRTVPASVVDHITPHKGDRKLFFDPDNTQSLCTACHDRHKQALERTGIMAGSNADGTPTDPNHLWNR